MSRFEETRERQRYEAQQAREAKEAQQRGRQEARERAAEQSRYRASAAGLGYRQEDVRNMSRSEKQQMTADVNRARNAEGEARLEATRERNRREAEAKQWINTYGLPGGGYGDRVGDEYRVMAKQDGWMSDPRAVQKWQESVLRDQNARREADVERWNMKREEGYEWAQVPNEELQKGAHWSDGSVAAWEAYQAGGGGGAVNYRDYYNIQPTYRREAQQYQAQQARDNGTAQRSTASRAQQRKRRGPITDSQGRAIGRS